MLSETRKVACLRDGQCDRRVLQILADAGWTVEAVDILDDAGPTPDLQDCHVGLLCLPQADPGLLDALEAKGPRWRHLELIAIVDPGVVDDERAREFVAARCADYQTLPVSPERLLFAIGHAEGMAALAHQVRETHPQPSEATRIIGHSAPMLALQRDLEKIARVDAPVTITGESGTGKELVARAIHELSARRTHPFVAVSCVSLPPTLIHAELFGFEKGAFTGAHRRKLGHFETAQHGTIFLDEIGDLDQDLQALLLRFLEERTVRRVGGLEEIQLDVRVIAATHVDLEASVKEGNFREDLYYRLNVLRVHMPPLRERSQDVVLLANAFLDRYSGERRGRLRGFSPSAVRALEEHRWPGNVRELMNRVRRAVVMAEGHQITAEDLQLGAVTAEPPLDLDAARHETERLTVIAALERTGYSATKAAALLGVSRATLYRLLSRHALSVEDSGAFRAASAVGQLERIGLGGDPKLN